MRRSWKRLAKSFLALTCAGAVWFAGADFSSVPEASGQSVVQGYNKPQAIPDFSIQDFQGKEVRLRDLRGEVILLNFWATWCPKCRQEGPSLQKLYDRYQSSGLVVYRVNAKEKPETIRQFMEKQSLNVPVLIDASGRTERLFGVWTHPTTYLINRQGLVCYRVMGSFNWTNPQAMSMIDELLKER